MGVIDLTNTIAKNHILTGRSALSKMGAYVSTDPRVIMILWDMEEDNKFIHNIWLIKKQEDTEIINGKVSFNQAIYDTLKYDYDDSAIYDLLDTITIDELKSFKNFLNTKKDKLEEKIIKYNFFGEIC